VIGRASVGAAVVMSLCLVAVSGRAEEAPLHRAPFDRAIVRFFARETGGVDAPRFIFERELAFEARLEALSQGETREGDPPYRPRDISAALERHIAETVLESLNIDPKPSEAEIGARVDQARLALIERVGGVVPLSTAARAEGMDDIEIARLLRRQALASLYLDRMVAPMLDPTDAELRTVQRTQRTPFSGQSFATIEAPLRRWYVQGRLAAAVSAYYDGLRTRLTVALLR
jgi:hypothetical protein